MINNNKYSGRHLSQEEAQKYAKQTSAEAPNEAGGKPAAAEIKNESAKEKPAKKKKKNIWLRITLCVLLVIVLLFAAVVGFVSVKLGKLNFADVRSSDGDSTSSAVSEADGGNEKQSSSQEEENVYNVLLIGVDNDYLPGMSDRGNADGIMLLSINPSTKQVVLTSIMRDISIQIPNQYSTKITLVYHNLGTETLIDTIEYNFDITIDNYALVNYLNIIAIIDALGGLDLEVSENEIYFVNAKMENINYLTGDAAGTDYLTYDDVGVTHLNGKQVAAWLRIRLDGGNDQKRTERARQVIMAAKDKVSDMGLLELNSFSDVVLENVTTDVTTTQALGLLTKVPAYLSYEFVSNRIPQEGSYTGDGSYIYIDLDENVKALHEAIYGSDE